LSEEELKAEIARINEQLERLGGGTTPATRAINDLGRAAGVSQGAMEDVIAGARGAGQGLISFGKNLTDGNKSMTKYGQSLNTLFSGLGDMLMAFGPLGFALGALSKIVGAVTAGVIDYNQAYLDAYDKLAEFGFAGTDVADNLKDLAQSTGYNSGKILELAKITTRLGTDVTSFGRTAGEGQKFFLEIAKVGADTRERFLRLGISQEELTTIQADYLKQQSKLSMFTVKDQAQLRENSKRYAESLVQLSALTGASRPELQAAFEEQMQDYKYQAYKQQALAEKGQAFVDNLDVMMVDLRESLDPSIARGMREVVATGFARGEDAVMLQTAFGDDLYKWADKVREGKITNDELTQAMRDKLQSNRKLMQMGPITDQIMKIFGLYGNALHNSVKKREKGTSAIVDSQMEGAQMPKPDDLKATQAKKVEAEIAMGAAYDNLIQFISGPVNYALRGLFKAVQYFAKAIAKRTPGGESLNAMLMDSSEIAATYTEKQKELLRLEKAAQDGKKNAAKDPSKIGQELIQDIGKEKPFVRKVAPIEQQIKELREELDALRGAYQFQTGKDLDQAPPSTPNTPSNKGAKGGGNFGKSAGWFEDGIVSGPNSGYMSGMTGMQAVVPLPDGKSIPAQVSFKDMPQQLQNKMMNPLSDSNAIASLLQNYAKAIPNITASLVNQVNMNQTNQSSLSDDMIILISNKMDAVIDNLRTNNDYQNELLTHVKK
jgi:hypothetical protein